MKFCRIAEGSADVYPRFGQTCEWDIAAGHAVVVASGGTVTKPNGEPLSYGHQDRDFRVPGFVAGAIRQRPSTPADAASPSGVVTSGHQRRLNFAPAALGGCDRLLGAGGEGVAIFGDAEQIEPLIGDQPDHRMTGPRNGARQ